MWWRRWLTGQGRGAVAALLVSLVGAGFSAGAGMQSPAAAPSPPRQVKTGYEAQDHFPGAATLYLIDATSTKATGTVALPPVPTGAIVPVDTSVRPAQPWVARGTPLDHGRALQCLTTAIYYEAATEPDAGQSAVAQVVLNRARHPSFPGTVCGVVYQGSERRGCQFSFACDGALARPPARTPWLRAERAAAKALAGYVFAPAGLATHYHTFAVTPAWNRGLVMTGVFGAHFFHRWQGWWGTPAAFSRSYAGGEPLPGPHLPTTLATTTPAVSITETTGAHRSSDADQDRFIDTAPESQILDKWKDSGKPLF